MKRFIEGMAVTLGLAGSAEAAPPEPPQNSTEHIKVPTRFTRETLETAVLPSEFDFHTPQEQLKMAQSVLQIIEKISGSPHQADEAFAALARRPTSKSTFEIGRLLSNILRNELLRIAPLLNEEQLREFDAQRQALARVGITLPTSAELTTATAPLALTRSGQEKIYRTYHELIQTLRPPLPATAEAATVEHTPIVSPPITPPSAPAPRVPGSERALHTKEVKPAIPGSKRHDMSLIREFEHRPVFALTFDDGPHPTQTARVLDILKQENVHATFFVVGNMVHQYGKSGVLQRMVEEGHNIGLHAYEHHDLPTIYRGTDPEIMYEKEVTRVNQELAKYGIPPSVIFRPPGGAISNEQLAAMGRHGMHVVDWYTDPLDYRKPGAAKIVDRVTNPVGHHAAKPGSIILLHDGGGDRRQTIEALPEIIKILKQRNGIFVTTRQALALDPMEGVTGAADAPHVAPESLSNDPDEAAREQMQQLQKLLKGDGSSKGNSAENMGTENPEVPIGAFGRDRYNRPFGWNFVWQYIHGPEDLPKPEELGPIFQTRELRDKPDGSPDYREGQLRTDAYEAFIRLQKQFEKAAAHNPTLREIGFWASEAGRDEERQAALRKKLGGIAAKKNESEHELFSTIDVRNARYKDLYYFAMGSPEEWQQKNFTPRFVREGFIPTKSGETWHFRYVGPEQAGEFYKKYRTQIINAHSRRLSNWPPPELSSSATALSR